MHNYNLIKSILSEPWAITELSLEMLSPMIATLFDNRLEFEKGDPILPEVRTIGSGSASGSSSERSYGISIISIKGAMTKDDQYCGPAGMATMGNWVKSADDDSNVDAIILKLDTPGGTVVGTEEFGNIIKNTKKPIIAFVDDMCCSGGYWLATQCDEIIANNNHATVGSIGVMMSFMDEQPYLESLGIKFHTIRADQSGDKNKIYDDLRAGKYTDYKAKVLNPLADKFIGIVKDARPGVEDTQIKGDTYFAHTVVGSLVDSIGNLDYAIERAVALCEENQGTIDHGANATETNPKPNSAENMKKITILGTEYEINAEGNIVLSEAQASAIVTALEESDKRQETITAHEATISAHAATIQTNTQTISELEAKITELEKEPGAESAAAPIVGEAYRSTYESVKSVLDSLK